jgi:hypothetical protein
MDLFVDFGKELLFFAVVVAFHRFEFFLLVDFGLYVRSDHLEVFSVHFGEFYGETLEIELDGLAPPDIGGVDVADFGKVL